MYSDIWVATSILINFTLITTYYKFNESFQIVVVLYNKSNFHRQVFISLPREQENKKTIIKSAKNALKFIMCYYY